MTRVFQPDLPFRDESNSGRDVECEMANMKSRTQPLKDTSPPSGLAGFSFSFTHSCDGSGLIVGDSRQVLQQFPANSFQCCITSPPYWGLRDYGVAGQIGAEMDLDQYVKDVTDVFHEVRRVLKDDGTFWLNIGDAYTSGNRTWRDVDKKNPARSMSTGRQRRRA